MATLAELYEFLETKQDDSHLDSRFSYDAFLPVEQPKARLEILTWWKIEPVSYTHLTLPTILRV